MTTFKKGQTIWCHQEVLVHNVHRPKPPFQAAIVKVHQTKLRLAVEDALGHVFNVFVDKPQCTTSPTATVEEAPRRVAIPSDEGPADNDLLDWDAELTPKPQPKKSTRVKLRRARKKDGQA